ncbi:putative serine C-palmitoyltransferase [Helianthus anomalus]
MYIVNFKLYICVYYEKLKKCVVQNASQVDKIDIITAAMGHALASEGGFCTGSHRVVDHQRLSSSGYVFSASLPPYLASAAIAAIDVIEENPQLITKLRDNSKLLSTGDRFWPTR